MGFSDRLRALAGLSPKCTCVDELPDGKHDKTCPLYEPPRTRIRQASFEHSHRVWVAPDPPRSWFEGQGIERVERQPFRWW